MEVAVYTHVLILAEEAIDIFKSAVGGLRIEEIHDGDK